MALTHPGTRISGDDALNPRAGGGLVATADDGSKVGWRPPAAPGADVYLVMPTGVGTDGQVLTSDGLGGVIWATPASGVTDHGALTGLTDDDHTQYALLAGRAGGQTIVGGTASGDDLTLASTSHATKGSIYLGSTKLEVGTGSGTRIKWPAMVTGETPGLEWFAPGGFGASLTVDFNGQLKWRDLNAGGFDRVTMPRTGGMTVSGIVSMDGMGLGSSVSANPFAFNAKTYTGGKVDAITFGTFTQSGSTNSVPRLAITTAVGAGDGVAEVAVRNAVLRVAHLADSAAPNDSVYYSTDAAKLVYKDPAGAVNNLY